MYDKEKVYDEKIYPLMDEVIKICIENNIQMVACFCIKAIDEDNSVVVTTYIPSDEYETERIALVEKFIKKDKYEVIEN